MMSVVVYLMNGQRIELGTAATATVANAEHGHVLVCSDTQGVEVGRFKWSELVGCTTYPDSGAEMVIRQLLERMSKDQLLALVESVANVTVTEAYPE
jgi:hypothetical protein